MFHINSAAACAAGEPMFHINSAAACAAGEADVPHQPQRPPFEGHGSTICRRPKCTSGPYRKARKESKLSLMGTSLPEEELERRGDERTTELVAALEKSEARFRALMENSIDVTVIVDADLRLQYV